MEDLTDNRLPTYLWVDAEVRRISGLGLGVYVAARGDKSGGMVVQKIANMCGDCRLMGQQRDLFGKLVWVNVLQDEVVPETEADAYIERAIKRDPDLWVLEIEDRELRFPIA